MKNEKAILYLLAMTNFCHVVDFMVLMPLGNELMAAFQIHPREFSWLVASYSISAGLSNFLASSYIDRFDRKKLVLTTLSLFALGTFCCAIASNYYWFLLARIITGMFGGLTGSVVIAIMSDLVPFERRGAAMGILSMAFAFASVLGVPIGLLVADLWNWQTPFYLIALLTIPVVLTLYKMLPPMGKYVAVNLKRNPVSETIMILKDENARMALLLAYTMILGHFLVIPFITPYAIRNVGMTQDAVKYIYLVGGAFTLVTAPVVGRYSDRLGHFNVFRVMLICSLFAIAAITNLVNVPIWVIVIITTSFFIFTSGRMIPAQTMMTGAVRPEIRGGFLSLRTALIEFGAGSASLISGWIVTETADGKLMNYHYVGYLSIAVAIGTIWVASRVKKVE